MTAWKKAALLFLSLLLLFLLPACGEEKAVVMAYDNVRLTEDVYRYWLSCYRAQFAYVETEENRAQLATLAETNIRKSLIAAALFDRMGLVLDDFARNQINTAMASLVADMGSREALEAELAVFGIDYDGLKQAISYETKAAALQNYLFGENGYFAIDEEQYEEYYREIYSRVRVITILFVDFTLDDDGERIFDQATQSYLYTEKSPADLYIQQQKAAAVRDAAFSGMGDEGFTALMRSYGEDPAQDSYPNGYYFAEGGDYATYIKEIPEAALAMEDGELREVESDYGVHFILRLPHDEGAWEKSANADFFSDFKERVANYCFEQYITQYLAEVSVYQEVKRGIRYEDCEPNFSIYW